MLHDVAVQTCSTRPQVVAACCLHCWLQCAHRAACLVRSRVIAPSRSPPVVGTCAVCPAAGLRLYPCGAPILHHGGGAIRSTPNPPCIFQRMVDVRSCGLCACCARWCRGRVKAQDEHTHSAALPVLDQPGGPGPHQRILGRAGV